MFEHCVVLTNDTRISHNISAIYAQCEAIFKVPLNELHGAQFVTDLYTSEILLVRIRFGLKVSKFLSFPLAIVNNILQQDISHMHDWSLKLILNDQ